MRLYGGINHNVQWGGKIVTRNTFSVRDTNPSDLIDYWYVITSKRIPTFGFVDPAKYDAIDRGNRIGNHLGSVDVGLEWQFANAKLLIYRQSFYDDGSLFQAANLADGLHGISWRRNKLETQNTFSIEGITAEFLNSTSQGGSAFSLDGGTRGRDDYFNHIQFWGWAYQNNTIGTPFINPSSASKAELQSIPFTNNNRVKLFHLGINGKLNSVNYLVKTSFSRNSGTYNYPFNPKVNQLSTVIDLSKSISNPKHGGWQGFLKIATDTGQLYPSNVGVFFGVRKNGQLPRR